MAVLALTLAGALTAIRGIPWFAFASHGLDPVAIGRRLESRKPGEPRRGLNLGKPLAAALRMSWRPGRCSSGATRSSRTTGRRDRRRWSRLDWDLVWLTLSPTASRTGCSGRSRSFAAALRTTCALRSTTASSSIGSATTTGSATGLEVLRGRLSHRRRRRDEPLTHRRVARGARNPRDLQERRADGHCARLAAKLAHAAPEHRHRGATQTPAGTGTTRALAPSFAIAPASLAVRGRQPMQRPRLQPVWKGLG